MEYSRALRVGEEMKKEVSRIIRDELKDPRIGFVSVTGVRVSNDLRHAKVFVSVYGDSEEENTSLDALKNAAGFIRREIGKRISLRHTPEIVFESDDSIAHSEKIKKLLSKVKVETEREEK